MTNASATVDQNILSLAVEGPNVFVYLNGEQVFDFVYDDTDASDLKRGLGFNARDIYNKITTNNNIQPETAESLLSDLERDLG